MAQKTPQFTRFRNGKVNLIVEYKFSIKNDTKKFGFINSLQSTVSNIKGASTNAK